MIELNDPLCRVERMMIRNRHNPSSEFYSLGALRRRCQEELGRGNRLPASRMVLADPEFVVVQLIQGLGKLEVALQLKSRMLADRVMRRQKSAEAKPLVHRFSSRADNTSAVASNKSIVTSLTPWPPNCQREPGGWIVLPPDASGA